MEYDLAVRTWGAKKLTEKIKDDPYYRARATTPVDPADVTVEWQYDEGYNCCGGRDSDCYCSQATAGMAHISISAPGVAAHVDAEDFDFVEVLREIVEAAGGTVTAPGRTPVPTRPAHPAEDDELW